VLLLLLPAGESKAKVQLYDPHACISDRRWQQQQEGDEGGVRMHIMRFVLMKW
jgi:hypothetical protein